MLQPQHITEYFINTYIKPGDTVADATAGNGHDTLKLCKAVGEGGKVYAFDIQKCALEESEKLLSSMNCNNYILIEDSHSEMDKYIDTSLKAVIFNLGYLPGGDHSICTRHSTTIEAIDKALALISDDGFISVTVYYGKNSGTEEKDKVMTYLENLNHKLCTVTVHDFFNRPNNPPLTVIITKNGI